MKTDAPAKHSDPAPPGARMLAALRAGKQSLLLATLCIYVLVLPIAHTIALRGLSFLVLLVLTLALLVERKQLPQFPLWQAWLGYASVGLVAVFLAIDPTASRGEFRTEFLYCYAIFMVGSIWGEQFASFKAFALLLAAANLVLVSFAFAIVGVDTPFWMVPDIPAIAYAGLNTNWILTVIFLHAWLILRLWQEGRRVLPFVLIGLIALDLWAMMVGYNRQAWLALGGGVACWGLVMLYDNFSWRRGLLLILVLGNVAVNFYLQLDRRSIIDNTDAAGHMRVTAETSVAERLRSTVLADPRREIWRFSLEKIAEHPLVGAGLGRYVFRKAYPEFHPDQVNEWHAHNMILNKGIQMGVPGMLTFLFLWLALAHEMLRHTRKSAAHASLAVAGLSIIGAVFVKNMTDDLFVRDTALMFWLVMGLLIGVLRSAQAKGIRTEPTNAEFLAPKQQA